ncbi:MAG: hypothetical protein ACIAXF_01295 [Phycisphaerales bacterium JB063]
MDATYREIRLDDIDDALAFVQAQGSEADREQVRHRLSLAVRMDGQTVGYGLCLGDSRGRFVVELALNEEADQAGLGQALADTVLRKMQSAGIGTARVCHLNEGGAEHLWHVTNWLDHIPSQDADPAHTAEPGDRPAEEAVQAA